jgi:hydrogenase expression/formation protein HypD
LTGPTLWRVVRKSSSAPSATCCGFRGSSGDLFQIKAQGGDVRVVYSPLDCLKIARANPSKQVVFFAIGFETTAPANAMSVWQARAQGITNYSILVSHVTVPPAMTAILEAPGNRVQAFLGAGHVCAIMGWEEYEPLAERYKVPIVVTGFEPVDLLDGILMAARQLESGRHEVKNQYARAVSREGNTEARRMISRVFETCDRAWRGIGEIPGSGYRLRDEFAAYDSARLFDLDAVVSREPEICISGLILQGARRPLECPAFGTLCTPETPLGATMVSGEGACAAYYNYGRRLEEQ